MPPAPPPRPQARPAAPPAPAMPSFALEKTLDVDLGGQTLRLYSIGAVALLKLEPLASRLFSGLRPLFSGATGDQQQAALLEVFGVMGQNPETLGYVILDALHDEPWNARPPSPAAIRAFMDRLDAAALLVLVQALLMVNVEAAIPLLQRLTGRATGPTPSPVSPEDSQAAPSPT
jgi:hypothetical protein